MDFSNGSVTITGGFGEAPARRATGLIAARIEM